jgi:hypothetical protein
VKVFRINGMDRVEAFDDCANAVELLDEDSEKILIEAYEQDVASVKPKSD